MKFLDCTLRDGGYYTNWDFEPQLVESYLSAIDSLPIDYIEVGYRNTIQAEYMGEYGYCPVSTLERIRKQCSKKIAIMLNEKSTKTEDLEQLLSPINGMVDMVRLAVDPKNFDRAVLLAQAIKEHYSIEIAFNVMYMSTWGELEGYYDKLQHLNGVVDLFVMVDSFGSVTPQDVKNISVRVKAELQCQVGFHGHNNLQLGLINTLTAIESGVDFVDSTIRGMGRGAGNLNTELLLTYLNKHKGLTVDFNVLGDVVSFFEPLHEQYKWGTSLPYMLSGANSIPQKDVMEWVQNRIYSFNSIVRALDNRKGHLVDNAKYPVFESVTKYPRVLIIGGGSMVQRHEEAIKTFVRNQDNTAIIFATARYAALFKDLRCDKFYVLVGNESKRLEQSIVKFNETERCILPPYPRKMGTDVPEMAKQQTFELKSISFINKYEDSCTTIAVELAKEISEGEVYIVGYDGYRDAKLSDKEIKLSRENEEIFERYAACAKSLVSLTPSLYRQLETKSIYSIL